MQKGFLQRKRALRTVMLVLLLSVVGMGKMDAQEFTVGTLRYSINGDGISVTVMGLAQGVSASGSLVIPESVTYNGTSYPITVIGDSAFQQCSGFTGSLTIPNSVTTIGGKAFESCRGFTGSLTIPNSVTTIGPMAFSFCNGFTGSLTIPNSVTEIGYCAFDYCTGFTGTLTIPNSVTKMGWNPISGCSGLEQIVVEPENPYYYSRLDFSLYSGDSLIGHYQENYNAIIR